jgi:hypothetical protein
MEDLTTLQESLFQAAKMTKSCSSEDMYSSVKSLMNLEEGLRKIEKTYFQAIKITKNNATNARYL